MRILRNYVLGEMGYFFVSCLFILTFLLVSGSVLTKTADLVINWGVDATLLGRLFLYSTPFLFNYTIPMSVLVAVLFSFGKMSGDHEITAMRASGISLWRITRPVLIAAFALSLVSFIINDRLSSESHYKVRQISAEIGMKTPASILEEGVFIKQFQGMVVFIHRITRDGLSGVRIYQPQDQGATRTIVAERGEIVTLPEKNRVQLKLMNGTTDEPDPDNPQKFYKLHFDTYHLPLDLSNYKYREPVFKKTKEMSVKELRAEYARLRSEHNFVAYDVLAEVHRKIAMSFSVFVFALIAMPLGLVTKRGEKSVGFAVALVLSSVYWGLFMGVTALAQTGTVPAFIALHLPNLLFAAVAVFMLRRLART